MESETNKIDSKSTEKTKFKTENGTKIETIRKLIRINKTIQMSGQGEGWKSRFFSDVIYEWSLMKRVQKFDWNEMVNGTNVLLNQKMKQKQNWNQNDTRIQKKKGQLKENTAEWLK